MNGLLRHARAHAGANLGSAQLPAKLVPIRFLRHDVRRSSSQSASCLTTYCEARLIPRPASCRTAKLVPIRFLPHVAPRQGLLQREDWNAARQVPLVAVPTGSGNGVAASSGLWDVTTAVVAVCRGRTESVDVATVLQPPNKRHYCLLSVVYGGMVGAAALRCEMRPAAAV